MVFSQALQVSGFHVEAAIEIDNTLVRVLDYKFVEYGCIVVYKTEFLFTP